MEHMKEALLRQKEPVGTNPNHGRARQKPNPYGLSRVPTFMLLMSFMVE